MPDEPVAVFDLTQNEYDVDWLRAARLEKKCRAGDRTACEQLTDMKNTKMWPHDELAASKD